MNVSTIFSCFDADTCRVLYPIMHSRATLHKCFTGYIDTSIGDSIAGTLLPLRDRPNDIVYRATHLPYWFGHHGQLKHRIAEVVGNRCSRHGLKCDISTRHEDTIVGDRWLEFLASGRAVIGCESGSSVLDRRGEIKALISSILAGNPSMSFEDISRRMPEHWDDFRFYAISPRHFEAIITKTCQILIEGHYDGVLKPGVHYIPLKRDFSNLDEVLKKVMDHSYLQDMVDRTYEEIYLSRRHTYKEYARAIEETIDRHRNNACGEPRPFDELLWKLAGVTIYVNAYLTAVMGKAYNGLVAVNKRLANPAGKC